MKRAPFLEMTASRTSLDGAKRISTYCGCILKLIVLIIYSILYLRRRWSTFEQQMRREECKRNRGEGKVASAVLGDDTGIVAPGNTGIFPWLDFLPTSAFSPAPYLQLKWWSSWASTVHTHACSLSLSLTLEMPGFFLQSELTPGHPPNHTVAKNKKAIHGWKSPTKTELLVWMLVGRL